MPRMFLRNMAGEQQVPCGCRKTSMQWASSASSERLLSKDGQVVLLHPNLLWPHPASQKVAQAPRRRRLPDQGHTSSNKRQRAPMPSAPSCSAEAWSATKLAGPLVQHIPPLIHQENPLWDALRFLPPVLLPKFPMLLHLQWVQACISIVPGHCPWFQA